MRNRFKYNPVGKRIFDIIAAIAAIVVLSPLFYVVMIFIKLDSAGPVFFKQKRTGKGLTQFKLIKFRSMTVEGYFEEKKFEPGDNRRVTKFGSILRKTKIDELPELFNVLRGDMSVVGPRPEVEKYIRAYPADFKCILKLRPGLSDYASIKYRNEEEMLAMQSAPEKYYAENILPDKLRLAKVYSENVTFHSDTIIIAETIWRILPISGNAVFG